MGMGSFAVNSFVIGYDDLKKICPDEITAIENEKFFSDIGWGVSCYDEDHDDIYNQKVAEEISEKYNHLVADLKNSFYEKTGLILYFDHYDSDGGDRYDEPDDKDGCIFCVSGMMVLSPAGEKFKDIVTERRWTQYG